MSDLVGAGLLSQQDLLMVEGTEGRRQTAAITPDGKINVAGQVFDGVSPAALRALELAGKTLKAVNGWATFRVVRAGNYIGTLLQIRGQYEDKEQEVPTAGPLQDAGAHGSAGPDPAVLAAVEQMESLLVLLPELTVNTSKSTISLYAGKLVVGYAYPRKKGVPRLRAYVGETCPEWVTPDPTYARLARDSYSGEQEVRSMTTIAIFPDHPPTSPTRFRAVAGSLQSEGATIGQALDALTGQLGGPEETVLIVVQPMRPDVLFTAAQQQRLAELMDRWRAARDSGTPLPPGEQAELDGLIEAELRAASERSAALTRQLPS